VEAGSLSTAGPKSAARTVTPRPYWDDSDDCRSHVTTSPLRAHEAQRRLRLSGGRRYEVYPVRVQIGSGAGGGDVLAKKHPDSAGGGRTADQATVDYFDGHLHEYGKERIRGVASLVKDRVPPKASLADIGSGTGTNLKRLSRQLGIRDITAMDVSRNSLDKLSQRMPRAKTRCVSILDATDLEPYRGQYDVVLMAAVLHHLVRGSRSASLSDARLGMSNALSLAKPGGVLIVMEPVFSPRVSSWGLFWLKRAVTGVTQDRVPIGSYWNNVGAPVVSFYTPEQVRGMALDSGGTIVAEQAEEESLDHVDRLIRKKNLTLVIQRPEGS